MWRLIFALTFLLAVAFFATALPAAELKLSLGIRQTFPAGDVDGDLDVDDDDLAIADDNFGLLGPGIAGDVNNDNTVNSTDINIIETNFGASTSGVVGSDGGTTGPLATTANQTLAADGTWQQLVFTLPLNLFYLPSDWGVLESLRFANTTDGRTRYRVWIDELASTNSGGATVFGDVESYLPGDEAIFQQPSVASGGDLLGAPDISQVTDTQAHLGSQSLMTEFEFVDDSPSRTAILSTAGVDNLPNPLVQLRDGDYSQVPVDGTVSFTETTISFWARAVRVPEPLTGDYNDNDIIDAADYSAWRDAVTAGATELLNDPTPGAVDESDFLYWRTHFGEMATIGSGAGSASSAAVPEPASAVLLLIGIVAGALVRRRFIPAPAARRP